MGADRETRERVLAAVPQQAPFRFIDEILELDETHIVGAYRFREDESFYRGHFPGRPVTPGVILVEAMAQTGVVAFGLYLVMAQGRGEEMLRGGLTTLFTVIETVEFAGMVMPGERVVIRGEKIYFRKGNLKAKVSMERENGEPVAAGVLAGMGVNLQ
ncbi:MAG: beta-hydroxyacyl-ACP dehydratase [Pseudomonadota bacterium]|jgi:3-hydroxyacyl-[acyl-carrier-protein] dehydratase|nr:beta-hydroxyacyl-ACP dehydratase [Syntrophaceae bacterium]MDI9555022.1 beta-hydroxyacyl-ACP dehydratase [Pseudomonadota bacterium]NLX30577.1 beta-hydroxyacyl-ACP dehydratase [Deltaproteobacteria bacterium]HNU85691.1 beta-hydroxyacyl-ACP dehydratase [Syntrophales bacterium]HNZ34871.1 beta-hydroxyacyl-ACP dehydratase [Syntrophales bacterium]